VFYVKKWAAIHRRFVIIDKNIGKNIEKYQYRIFFSYIKHGLNTIIHRSTAIAKFTVHTKLNPNVVLLRIFPSIMTETVAHFLKPPIEGVVLQCYGAGNMPSNRTDIMDLLKSARERGVIILTVTQCSHGSVSGIYATGKALLDIGIIPGNDMTPEAALTKMSYVLSKEDLSLDQKRKMMETNLVGEMTVLSLTGSEKSSKNLTKVHDDSVSFFRKLSHRVS
jgi:L-asparaginase/Glu-tRNA(Gln) amidotransferase subunit D